MRYDLAQMTRRAKNPRRSSIKIRDIRTPTMFAGDLYRAAYLPAINVWADAIPAIVSEYSRTIGQTTDSPADIEQKMQEAERRFNLLALTITPSIQRWALRVESWWRGKWRSAILSATNVDIGTLIGPSDVRQTLEAAINWNVALVKDVGAEAQRRMTSIIYDGLRGNKPAREVAKELRGVVDLGRARSVRIASDQLAKLTSTLADERRREAGLDAWIWLHSGKRNGRDDHIARDGKEYSDANPPADMPGQLPYCGCRSQSVLNFD
ncbi:MAG: phage minor head protein [Pseudomonadota bacterium]